MRIDVIHPRELGAPEQERWAQLRDANPSCSSPYLAFGFTRLVGEARADARVAVLQDANQIVGFLPVQRPSPFSAMALGTPIADVQGLIGPRDLDIPAGALCRALNVGHIDFSATPLEVASIGQRLHARSYTHIARLEGNTEAYQGRIDARGGVTQKRLLKKAGKLKRDHGEPLFNTDSRDRALLDQLLTWKRDQCIATSQPPVWSTRWVVDTLDRLWQGTGTDLRLRLATAHVNDTPVAVQLYLQSGQYLHLWMIGHDHDFNVYSPGLMFAQRFALWAADAGFEEIDYGGGDYQFKAKIATEQRPMAWGSLTRLSASGLARKGLYAARAAIEKLPHPALRDLPGRAMRRLDMMRGLGLTPPRRPSPA